jgi:hypothetical protein
MSAKFRNFGRARPTTRRSGSEALAAAAGFGCVGIVEAQPPGQAILHEVEGRALDVRQACRIDNDLRRLRPHDSHAGILRRSVRYWTIPDYPIVLLHPEQRSHSILNRITPRGNAATPHVIPS